MDKKNGRGGFGRWLLASILAVGCLHAIRGHAEGYKSEQPLPDCWKIDSVPASESPCKCDAGRTACADYKQAALKQRKECVGVLTGERGQRGCQTTMATIGTRGLCVMRIDKDAEAQLRNCEAVAVAEFVICVALTPPPWDLACGGLLVAQMTACANEYGRYPCSLWKCVQDPSVRIEAQGLVATGFDPRTYMSGECVGKGPG